MLTALGMPLAAALVFCIMSLCANAGKPAHTPEPLRRFLKTDTCRTGTLLLIAGMMAGAEIVLFLLLTLAVSAFTISGEETALHPGCLLLAACLPMYAIWLWLFCPKQNRLRKTYAVISAIALLLLPAEVFLFNAKSFTTDKTLADCTISELAPVMEGEAAADADSIVITGNTTLTLNDIPAGMSALTFDMQQKFTNKSFPFFLNIEMEDGNFSRAYIAVSETRLTALDAPYSVQLSPYGDIRSLKLNFREISEPVTLKGICFSKAVPYAFIPERYLFLLLAGAALAIILVYRLHTVTYTRKPVQIAALAVMTMICTASVGMFYRPDEPLIDYDAEKRYTGPDPYVEMFDAFLHGEVALDDAPDPGLAELDNPYDNSERNESGIPARWDFAYFEGKYYSYFGAAPVIAVYYPFYALTGKLPTTNVTSDILSGAAIFCFCLALIAAVRLMIRRPNFLLLLLSLPAGTSCFGALFAMQYGDKYYVAVASALCFISMTLCLGLWGCLVKREWLRYVLFAGSGAALAFCVASRPGVAVNAAVLLPFFFGILFRKSVPLVRRIRQAACFLVPLFAGLGVIFAYNTARFGSPLDFGAAYQLTVSDVHANTVQLDQLPAAVFHYFCQTPNLRTTFPFVELRTFSLRNYGKYQYQAEICGALAFPMLSVGTLLLFTIRRRHMPFLKQSTRRVRYLFLLLCFAVPVVLAWMDFCIGGVNQRYIIDILPLLTLGTVIVMQHTADPERHGLRYAVSAVSLPVTMGLMYCLLLSSMYSFFRDAPYILDLTEDMLIFWK